ncbi:hypothetical protein K501DRAFT_269409 [Backusella circina FSU 941]|nr:hypothetical protein K501DRAFT_269409 [Backusella circina FSU 941]
MSTFKKLKDKFSQYRSVKVHVAVAALQLIIALGLMIPAIIIIALRNDHYYIGQEMLVESITYISFEVFRLWLVLDSSFFEYLYIGFHIQGIVTYIQFAFSCSLIVLTPPALWAAYKMSKDFGWGVYKKIGASLDVQNRVSTCPTTFFFIKPEHIRNMSLVFKIHVTCSILCCLGTIIISVWCLLHFNKDLKEHSAFFKVIIVVVCLLKIINTFSAMKFLWKAQNKQGVSEELLSTRVEIPIDED